jgi:PTS system nitrogen regulatory IIA component
MQLTLRDVTHLFNVPEQTIQRWIQQRKFPAHRVNGRFRFNRTELLEWATAEQVKVSVDLFEEPEGAGQTAPSLVDALRAGGVFHGLKGSDKASALWAVVDTLPLPPEVDRQFLLRILLAREALASTGVGGGIAIPHVRNPLVLPVSRPLITLCFLEQPIEFGALDGRPVDTLFTLISPTVRTHLHLLSRLSFALHDPGFKEVLNRRASAAEILHEADRVEAGFEQPGAGAGGASA